MKLLDVRDGVHALRSLAIRRLIVTSNGQQVSVNRLGRWLEMCGRIFLVFGLRCQTGAWPNVINITSGYGPRFTNLDCLAVTRAQEVALQTEQKRQQLAG